MELIGLESLASYGLSGVIIAIMLGFIIYRDKMHTLERKELAESYSKNVDKWLSIWEKSNGEVITIMKETNAEIRSLRESLWVVGERRV